MRGLNEALGAFRPRLGLVLGSGLGEFVDSHIDVLGRLAYSEFACLAEASVPGHAGCFVWGYVEGRPVLCQQGRLHFYEGHSMAQITQPIRMLQAAGVEMLVLTNAAGGIRPNLKPGDFMLLEDHINWMGANPLIGMDPLLGNRFPDMTAVYDRQLLDRVKLLAQDLPINLKQGVYLATTGPCFETPAEIRAFANLGADAVGMSTVPEAIVARQCGLRVLGLSCITNAAAGLAQHLLSHQDVAVTAARVRPHFNRLMAAIIVELTGRV